MGKALQNQGKFNESMKYYVRAFNINKNQNEPNQIEIAGILHQMGMVFYDLNDLDKSLKYFERALNIFDYYNGLNHIESGGTIH